MTRRTKAAPALLALAVLLAGCSKAAGAGGTLWASSRAIFAISTAWSPIRSRSVMTFRAVPMTRRSAATGCWLQIM